MSETTGIDFFERVKGILKDKIIPVLPGDAKTFRDNINNAIGIKLPEITADEQGVEHIIKDGEGMSGAIYAMGEAVRDGLKEVENATKNANDAAGEARSTATTVATKVATDITVKAINNYIVVAKADSSNSFPVKINESGEETEIEQSPGAVWFKIMPETNTSTETV